MATSRDLSQTRVRSAAALGRTIRRARTNANMTQTELADHARANRYAIAQLESGKETRALELIFDTLTALDLELVVHERTK